MSLFSSLSIISFAFIVQCSLYVMLPIHWVPGIFSPGVKWPGRETDHSVLSRAEVKNAWSYTSTPLISLHGVVLSDAYRLLCI
jgi:hypothetical protein